MRRRQFLRGGTAAIAATSGCLFFRGERPTDRSRSAGNGVIDSFEDGDLSEYTVGERAGRWPRVSDAPGVEPIRGQRLLEVVSGNLLTSTAGLARYPARGDSFEFWVHFNGVEYRQQRDMGMLFGVQDPADHYRAFIGKGDGQVHISRETSTGRRLLATQATDVPVDRWLRCTVDWTTAGEISFTVADRTGTRFARLSAQDDTYAGGGVGWEARDNGTDPSYFGTARFVGPPGR